MRGSSATSGRLCSSSHFDTAAFVTPRWAASSPCVTCAARRSRAMAAPKLMSCMRGSFFPFGARPALQYGGTQTVDASEHRLTFPGARQPACPLRRDGGHPGSPTRAGRVEGSPLPHTRDADNAATRQERGGLVIPVPSEISGDASPPGETSICPGPPPRKGESGRVQDYQTAPFLPKALEFSVIPYDSPTRSASEDQQHGRRA